MCVFKAPLLRTKNLPMTLLTVDPWYVTYYNAAIVPIFFSTFTPIQSVPDRAFYTRHTNLKWPPSASVYLDTYIQLSAVYPSTSAFQSFIATDRASVYFLDSRPATTASLRLSVSKKNVIYHLWNWHHAVGTHISVFCMAAGLGRKKVRMKHGSTVVMMRGTSGWKAVMKRNQNIPS